MSDLPIVGIDTGGTFTDVVVIRDGKLEVHKEPSTPDDPARAVLTGLAHLLGTTDAEVVHGSTVATNALLERTGACTALVCTAGFEDVLEIGRQIRPAIYDINVEKPAPLVPPERRLGLAERMDASGTVLTPLTDEALADLVNRLAASGADSIAICLLHAYANPEHERRVADTLRQGTDAFVTASHEVLPEFREYERTSTTAVNAFVGPVMTGYLTRIGGELDVDRVRIMQSNGGIVSLTAARDFAVHTVLSGPAGGAVGGLEIARRAGFDHIITFDMGGTSTDVSLCPGHLVHTAESIIGGLPIRVPVIDIHTVGAGGGSIAWRDPGGSLRSGPQSAGAVPGPVCYDRGGTEPTVTDANLVLGRLSPAHFLGGRQTLPVDPARAAIAQLATSLNLSPIETAEGILRVTNATMERAIRVISLERGYDPRDFTLVCFGGAGGMHAADLARALGLPRVLIPRAAGTLSALGMLLADVVRDYSRTVLLPVMQFEAATVEQAFRELEERAHREFAAEGHAADAVRIERSVDMRYVGQGYELSVPFADAPATAFHDAHEARYGYADRDRPVEIVNVRVRATAPVERREPDPMVTDSSGTPTAIGRIDMTFDGRTSDAPVLDRDRLPPGYTLEGPALIVEYSTTTVVPPDFLLHTDPLGNLILEPCP